MPCCCLGGLGFGGGVVGDPGVTEEKKGALFGLNKTGLKSGNLSPKKKGKSGPTPGPSSRPKPTDQGLETLLAGSVTQRTLRNKTGQPLGWTGLGCPPRCQMPKMRGFRVFRCEILKKKR